MVATKRNEVQTSSKPLDQFIYFETAWFNLFILTLFFEAVWNDLFTLKLRSGATKPPFIILLFTTTRSHIYIYMSLHGFDTQVKISRRITRAFRKRRPWSYCIRLT